MATIEIDGQQFDADSGTMIIEVADKAGIAIPRFCYHKKLSVAANCRMCLVDVEKSGKPLPACATPISDGMVVHTRSAKAIDAQRSVMEFLLINHPLDCPICDQGGECELQDVSMGYGGDISRFSEGKRSVKDKDIGPLIITEMTRCIHCTRCVRFGEEVAGLRELGGTGRGENTEIGTYIEHSLRSEVAGNVIDLCPVGALTDKTYRFTARAWELSQHASVSPHDCLGTNIYAHTRRGQVMRVVPRENESINETWIADRDRYSYQGINSDERLKKPMIKRSGRWSEVDWETAFEFARSGLRKVIDADGAEQLGVLASPSATLEEGFLLQRLARGLGSANIDHRVRRSDFSDQEHDKVLPELGVSLQDLETQNAILLLGCDIHREQPLAALRIRKASLHDAKVSAVNLRDCAMNFDVSHNIVAHPNALINELAGIAKALLASSDVDIPASLKDSINAFEITASQQAIADELKSAENASIILGAQSAQHAQAAVIRSLATVIANCSGASVGGFTAGANAAGLSLAGVLPHRGPAGQSIDQPGRHALAMFEQPLKAYLLLGIEPELDCAAGGTASQALQAADFVVSLSAFTNPAIQESADVLLPITPFTETSGTYINVNGQRQSFAGASKPQGEARPGWKVLRVLANVLELGGFDYTSSEQVKEALLILADKRPAENSAINADVSFAPVTELPLTRLTAWPIYRVDGLVRRAIPLQETAISEPAMLHVNRNMAVEFKLQQGNMAIASQNGVKVKLPVSIDDSLPDNVVYIPAGFSETADLPSAVGPVKLSI